MGLRAIVVSVKNEEDVQNAMSLCEIGEDFYDDDFFPRISGLIKVKSQHYLLMITDGDDSLKYFLDFGLFPHRLEAFKTKRSGNGWKIQGSKYFTTLLSFEKSLEKAQ